MWLKTSILVSMQLKQHKWDLGVQLLPKKTAETSNKNYSPKNDEDVGMKKHRNKKLFRMEEYLEFYTYSYIPQAIHNAAIILCGMYVRMGVEFQIFFHSE